MRRTYSLMSPHREGTHGLDWNQHYRKEEKEHETMPLSPNPWNWFRRIQWWVILKATERSRRLRMDATSHLFPVRGYPQVQPILVYSCGQAWNLSEKVPDNPFCGILHILWVWLLAYRHFITGLGNVISATEWGLFLVYIQYLVLPLLVWSSPW